MPGAAAAAVLGGTQVLGSILGANAARSAASTQARAAEAGQATQMAMFERTQEILRPYVQAGEAQLPTLGGYAEAGPQAFERQLALAGLAGPQAQQAAISQVQAQPRFGALTQAGEEAILANAAATGGLRGGNTQNALARFRADLLADELEREYARFGGLTAFGQGVSQNLAQMGQAAGAGTGVAAMQAGQGIAALQGQAGAARAGGTIGSAQAYGNLLNLPAQVVGLEYGLASRGRESLVGRLFS